MKDNKENNFITETNKTNKKSKKSALAIIVVFLIISLISGLVYAIFSHTFVSSENVIHTSTPMVYVKVSDSLSGSYNNDLENTVLFDNISIDPGQTSSLKFIKIRNNDPSKKVKISEIKLIDVSATGNWTVYSRLLYGETSMTADDFTEAESKPIVENVELNGKAEVINSNSERIIAVAIKLDNSSTSSNDSVKFKIHMTIDEVE